MLSYATESPIVKEQVKQGKISVSTVIKLQKDIPLQSERVKVIGEAISRQDNTKTSKPVSLRDIKGTDEVHTLKFERMADEIIDVFSMPDSAKEQLLKIIKSYN